MIAAAQSVNKASEKKESDKEEFGLDPQYCEPRRNTELGTSNQRKTLTGKDPAGMTREGTAVSAVVSASSSGEDIDKDTSRHSVNKSDKEENEQEKMKPSSKKKIRNRDSLQGSASTVDGNSARKLDGNSTADSTTVATADSTGAGPSSSRAEVRKSDAKGGETVGSKPRSKRSSKNTKNGVSKDGAEGFDKKDVAWQAEKFESEEEWEVENVGKDSPSVWDPDSFVKQTEELGSWKETGNEPTRVQDIASPLLSEDAGAQPKAGDDEEWPFKSPCAFHGKKGKSRTPRSGQSATASDIESVDSRSEKKPSSSSNIESSSKRPSKKREGRKSTSSSSRADGDGSVDASKQDKNPSIPTRGKRESRKGSTHSRNASGHSRSNASGHNRNTSGHNRNASNHSRNANEASEHSKDKFLKNRASKDQEPSRPSRSHRSAARPDTDDDSMDQPPSKPKSREENVPPKRQVEDDHEPKMPKRRSNPKTEESTGSDSGEEELGKGSFHGLKDDFDKPRQRNRGRKNRDGRVRRRVRDSSADKSIETSSVDDNDIDSYDEFGEETEYTLKDEEEEPMNTRRQGWRERRASNRAARERNVRTRQRTSSADADRVRPGEGARRPPSCRRAILRRAQSESWRSRRDHSDEQSNEGDSIKARSRGSQLSRSSHSVRRYNSGGLNAMTGGLDRRTYHGPDTRTDRLERRIRKPVSQSDSLDSGSAHNDSYEYDMNVSGRSQRTLDSIEDLEDFEHIDFQTPGMIDVEEEIIELMGRANPEVTAQLNRRVHRQRDRLAYDQNMPMMTRQALMTRQGSAQVTRRHVDTSGMDRDRFLIRTDSMSSVNSKDELSFSGHGRPRAGGRRPPPRTKSSGFAGSTEIPRFLQQGSRGDREPDRRQLFRTRSTNTSSFRQYLNKPNKVAQLSRRPPGGASGSDAIDRHSARGGPSSHSDRPIKPIQRAKSTTALRRPRRDPRAEERNAPPAAAQRKAASPEKDDQMPDLKSTSSDSDDEKGVKRSSVAPKDDDSIKSEESESSSVDSDPSPKKVPKRKPKKSAPPKAVSSPAKVSPKKVLQSKASPSPKNKRDMTRKSNRRKLHSLIYEHKMGINMKDLFKEVKKGKTSKSAVKPSSPRNSP